MTRPKKITSMQSHRLAKAMAYDYIFEPSENRGLQYPKQAIEHGDAKMLKFVF